MNNLIIWTLFISFQLGAATVPETVIVLESLNHRGVILHKDIVLIKDGSVIVNSEKLSPTEIITQSNSLQKISIFIENGKNIQCDMGIFKHIYKKGKIIKVEHGCLNNDRYNDLVKSFRALKKDRITE